LIEDAIRGDPCSPLRWVSRSLRHLVKALAAQGFQASQRVVATATRAEIQLSGQQQNPRGCQPP
jgi:Rhodopirellula transposase DDE domain